MEHLAAMQALARANVLHQEKTAEWSSHPGHAGDLLETSGIP